MGNKRGFTLVEVLIATAIMVSVLGALVHALTQSSNLTETMRNQDIALNAAQQRLETIANDISNITDYNDPNKKKNFLVAGLTPDPAGSTTISAIVANELYNATVTVTWTQRGGRQISRTLTTAFQK